MVVNSLLLMIISIIIVADQTIHRKSYELDNDITGLEVGSSFNIELTFIDSTAARSTLEIETEKWVHNCCLEIKTKPHFFLSLKQNDNIYPKITVYLRLRTPLSYIKLDQAANLVIQNYMKIENLVIELFQASNAKMKVQISGTLYVSMSGSSHLIMDGFVDGATVIYVRQAAEFDGRSCRINDRFISVEDAGVVYVKDAQYTRIKNSQTGAVHIKDSEEDEDLVVFKWMNKLFNFKSTAARTSVQLIHYFLILFFIVYFFVF